MQTLLGRALLNNSQPISGGVWIAFSAWWLPLISSGDPRVIRGWSANGRLNDRKCWNFIENFQWKAFWSSDSEHFSRGKWLANRGRHHLQHVAMVYTAAIKWTTIECSSPRAGTLQCAAKRLFWKESTSFKFIDEFYLAISWKRFAMTHSLWVNQVALRLPWNFRVGSVFPRRTFHCSNHWNPTAWITKFVNHKLSLRSFRIRTYCDPANPSH